MYSEPPWYSIFRFLESNSRPLKNSQHQLVPGIHSIVLVGYDFNCLLLFSVPFYKDLYVFLLILLIQLDIKSTVLNFSVMNLCKYVINIQDSEI